MVSNIFYFHPYLGKCSNLTNIFQMGWNHQQEKMPCCCGAVAGSRCLLERKKGAATEFYPWIGPKTMDGLLICMLRFFTNYGHLGNEFVWLFVFFGREEVFDGICWHFMESKLLTLLPWSSRWKSSVGQMWLSADERWKITATTLPEPN